jgi:ribosome-associated translation inhibitor RaiA
MLVTVTHGKNFNITGNYRCIVSSKVEEMRGYQQNWNNYVQRVKTNHRPQLTSISNEGDEDTWEEQSNDGLTKAILGTIGIDLNSLSLSSM